MPTKEWWLGIAVYYDRKIELSLCNRSADQLDRALPAADVLRTPAVTSLDVLLGG